MCVIPAVLIQYETITQSVYAQQFFIEPKKLHVSSEHEA